jgi:hypothetical protein
VHAKLAHPDGTVVGWVNIPFEPPPPFMECRGRLFQYVDVDPSDALCYYAAVWVTRCGDGEVVATREELGHE